MSSGDTWVRDGPTLEAASAATRSSLGPYSVEAVLGRGGMGVVYRGRSPEGEPVALKALHLPNARLEALHRFEREASIKLEHPNVIRALDAGADEDGTPYIVFELLEGEGLEAILERGAMPVAEVLDLALQAATGLLAVHRAGIVHRDLKPGNLFVCDDGRVKVLDFGIARVAGESKLTTDGMVVGTPQYFSPEQASGVPNVGVTTDIWALGAVCYEALTGQPPFVRDSYFATMLAIVMDKAPAVRSVAPRVPRALAAAIDRCLAKRPEDRFQSIAEMLEALEAVSLEGGESEAPSVKVDTIRPDEQRVVAILLARNVFEMATLEAVVEEYGGSWVPLFGADAIGLFGGQKWEGDEVERAVMAALHGRHGAEWVGVGSGRARASGQGLSGDAVRSAERVCMRGLIGVAVDTETARAVGRRFSLREAGDGVLEVLGERTGSLAPWPGEESVPMVGREAQLGQLGSVADGVVERREMCAVTIRGAAGVGKTRLFEELGRRLEAGGSFSHVLVGAADSLHRGKSLGLVRSMLRRRARVGALKEGWPRIDADASLAERRQAVMFLAREAFADAREAFECGRFLGTLLGVDMPDSVELRAARGDAALMADRLKLAAQDYLVGLAQEGPAAVLADDVQWADPASLEVLWRAAELAWGRPWLLVMTGREGVEVPSAIRAVVELTLRGLGKKHVAEIARAVAGEVLPEARLDALVDRTEGNPLFVVQTVRALVEQGGVTGSGELPLPVTVEAALQVRLDALESEERELLRSMSVFDRPMRMTDVVALSGAPETAVRATVEGLVERDVLSVPLGWGGGSVEEISFASALLRDIAYRTLTEERAVELHRRAAEWLGQGPDVDAEETARHHERAGDVREARRWFLRAALEASARGDGGTVLRCSERALEGEMGQGELYELRMARADAFRFRGDRDAQEVELSEALVLASSGEQRARVETELSWAVRARPAEALAYAEDAVRTAEAWTGPVLARAEVALAEALTFGGQLGRASEILSGVGEVEDLPPLVQGLVWEARGLLASAQGDLGAARTAYVESAGALRKAGHLRRMTTALQNQADLHNRVYAFAEATAALGEVLAMSRRAGNTLPRGYAYVNLGYARGGLGQVDEALAALAKAEEHARAEGNDRLAGFAAIYRVRALVRGERARDAVEAGRDVLSLMKDQALGLRAIGLTAVARAYLLAEEDETALTHAEEAMRIRDELGALEEDEGELFLVLGKALERLGREEEARPVYVRGAARVREMAQRIADEEWRERFLSGEANAELLSCSA